MASLPAEKFNKRKAVESATSIRNVRWRLLEAPQHGEQIVIVTVGKANIKRTFTLHKDLLAKHSRYFASAFGKGWKESASCRMTLADDKVECFEIFQHFIYTGKIFASKDSDAYTTVERGYMNAQWKRLCQCWVLGDKYQSNSFKDAVTDATIAKHLENGRYPRFMHETIYDGSVGTSGMRRSMVHLALWIWRQKNFQNDRLSKNVNEFFFDLAVAFQKKQRQDKQDEKPFAKEDTCNYHDHGDTPCYKTMF